MRAALVVAAHPDDAESWCAGTVAALVGRGARVAFLLLTSGDKGTADPLADPRRVAARREAEQRAAGRILGVRDLTFLRLPDGEVADSPALRAAIGAQIERVRPDLLLTFDPWRPYAFHNDHREAGFAALAAAFPPPAGPRAAWLFNTDRPDRLVDIGATFPAKVAARVAHASQTGDPAVLARRFRERAAATGAVAGLALAESFHELAFPADGSAAAGL